MQRLPKLQGVFVPMLTPFMPDGSLDSDGFRRYAEMLLASDAVDGLFALGATGEFDHLSCDDRKVLIEILGTLPHGDKTIVANTGGLDVPEIRELTCLVRDVGLDAAAITVPEDVDTDPTSVVTYIAQIAELGVPFTVYWTPMVKKHKPTVEAVRRLLAFPTFVGLKDSSRDMVTFTDIAGEFGRELSIFQGVEMLHLASLAVGSCGIIGGGLNLYPALLADIGDAFRCGDMKQAQALQLQVNRSWEALADGNAFRSCCKQYWHRKGILEGTFCRSGGNIAVEQRKLDLLEDLARF